jgi:type I restriction enzyme M protein
MAQTNANLIWNIANLLRGPYQPNQYGDVILPFTILRRLDCILEPTKNEVLAELSHARHPSRPGPTRPMFSAYIWSRCYTVGRWRDRLDRESPA